jgi:hypothetical protein
MFDTLSFDVLADVVADELRMEREPTTKQVTRMAE